MEEYKKENLIEELKVIKEALTKELVYLRRRKMGRNDEQSLKWRSKSYYYKNKAKFYAEHLKTLGHEMPIFNHKIKDMK